MALPGSFRVNAFARKGGHAKVLELLGRPERHPAQPKAGPKCESCADAQRQVDLPFVEYILYMCNIYIYIFTR